MNGSRRSFLQSGSKLGLASMFTGSLGSIVFGQTNSSTLGRSVPQDAVVDSLYNITRTMFTQNLKTKFGVSLSGSKLTTMTLVEVNDLNQPSTMNNGTTNRDCYSLVFSDRSNRTLGQNTYNIEHPTLGKFQLFIVQGGQNGSETRYTGVINRVLS